MEKVTDISEELKLLSPMVCSISRNTPYVAPVGYFNDLSDKVLTLLATSGTTNPANSSTDKSGNAGSSTDESGNSDAGQNHPSALLGKIGKQTPFAVPSSYFEEFAQKLLDHIKAIDANKIPSVNIQSDKPLTDSHFSEGNDDISSEKELEQLSPLLSSLRKTSPFRTPESYFADLSTNVLSGVQAIEFVNDELENLSPMMNELKSKSTYQAPSDYFENLAGLVLSKARESASLQTPAATSVSADASISSGTIASSDIPAISGTSASPNTAAKIIALPAKRTWWKYAAAAITVGLIFSAGWLTFNRSNKPSVGPNDIIKNLARVSDQDIQNYLDNHNIPLAEAVSSSTATLDISDSDISEIKTMLGDVPDEELKIYLDEHGGTRDLATN